jgi:site-specific DNA-methyltransferase (adenine-specific)
MTTSLAPYTTPPTGLAAADQLGLSGRLVGDHYTLPADTPVEAWLLDGEVLQSIEKRVGFWIGDWLRAGEDRYGNARYTQALQATGHAFQTLKNAKSVAGKFPVEDRVHEGLAFGHYSAASGLPQADAHELLEEAAELKLSTKDLRDRVRHRQDQIRAAEHAQKPVPRTEIGGCDLWVGDALSLTLDDGVVDLIVTSPPYALKKAYDGAGDLQPHSWFDFITASCAEAYRVTKPGGRFALNIPLDTTIGGCRPTYAEAVAAGLASGWKYRSSIVWIDGHLGKSTARGSFDQEHQAGTAASPSIIAPSEMIILFSKGAWWRETPPDRPSYIDKDDWISWTNGCWYFWGEKTPWEEHPAPFPEELPTRLIHLLSFPGDLVLDPFLGSGTTAVAAMKAGRRIVGTDISQTYINSSLRRVATLLETHPGLDTMTDMS